MLTLTIEKYENNEFYKSQMVKYFDVFGNKYTVLDVRLFSVNYLVSLLDENLFLVERILGGHEKLEIEIEEELMHDF